MTTEWQRIHQYVLFPMPVNLHACCQKQSRALQQVQRHSDEEETTQSFSTWPGHGWQGSQDWMQTHHEISCPRSFVTVSFLHQPEIEAKKINNGNLIELYKEIRFIPVHTQHPWEDTSTVWKQVFYQGTWCQDKSLLAHCFGTTICFRWHRKLSSSF